MDDVIAELRRRAEIAEGFVATLTEQLRAAEKRDLDATGQIRELQAQTRQLTALVEGMQRQLADALTKLAALEPKKTKGKGSDDKDAAKNSPSGSSASSTPPPAGPGPSSKTKGKPKRPAALPAHLPRQTTSIPVSQCGTCGSVDLASVGGGEVSERYHYVPAQIVIERIERATCRCRTCGSLTTAPLPPTAVPGGSMTAALLAHIAYSKCALHLPLDRIAEDLRRLGADFADATMCDAMGHVATLLEPVHDRIVEDLFASGLVHLDGTGVKVLTPGERGSYRGQFLVLSNPEATAYVFSESKHGEHIANFLRVGTPRSYRGYLVADAASNMDVLYEDGAIIECGCWFHARDKFEDAKASSPKEAAEGIAWIGALFQVEHEADAAGDSPDARKARRQRDSRSVLDALRAWMTEIQSRFRPDEELYKAVRYCDKHWTPLTRFLDDGRIPLTNNLAERDLGPVGRGRKAWLFAGSDQGGHRLAKIYTVVNSCLRLGIDPRAYLTDVLPRLSVMPVNRQRGLLATLVPKAWKARQLSGADPPPPE